MFQIQGLGIKVYELWSVMYNNNYAQKIQNFILLYNFEVSEQSLSLQFYENHRSKPRKIRTSVEIDCLTIFPKSLHRIFDQNLSRPGSVSSNAILFSAGQSLYNNF